MNDAQQPRAFISHASEDKDTFVRAFATKLRGRGIDAWVDEWEIRAGDSLVDKVFAYGIDGAEVFIVVLSAISVTKPWVQEELDAAVVRRIARGTKLIPVLLEEVAVPAALQHLRYVSVPKLGLDGAVEDVCNSVFSISVAPPLAPVPRYTRRRPTLTSNVVDDAVLEATVDLTSKTGPRLTSAEDLHQVLQTEDVSLELIEEAIESLAERGHVDVLRTGGGPLIKQVSPRAWLAVLEAHGVDVDAASDRLLAHLVNRTSTDGFEEGNRETVRALVSVLHLEGAIKKPLWTGDGTAHVIVTAAGQRRAREL